MSGTPTKIKLPGVECESKSPAAPPTPSQAKREQDAAILTSPKRSPGAEPLNYRSPPKSPKITSESLKSVTSPKPLSL